jgi:D-alanyl-D-alanine carboxypeptidase (penicillin-binding protein 5/6)
VSARIATAFLALALVAPAPAFAVRLKTDVVDGVAVGAPGAERLRKAAPDITAPAGILTTADGRVLWARGAHARRPMASTTKIMTAVVVLERARLSDVVTVSRDVNTVEEGGVGLVAGERLTVRQLLEALLVRSGNDAAVALAVHVAGSVPRFAVMMNEKAAQLGLKDTHYVNPHGLTSPGHFSSAADLAVLARYAMRDPEFRRVVLLQGVVLPRPNGQNRLLKATDALIGAYPGLVGVKTGFTNPAGYCFVSAAQRDGIMLYGVVLGTKSERARFKQTAALLDWGFKHYRRVPVVSAATTVGTVHVADFLDRDVTALTGEATSAVIFDLAGPLKRTYELRPSIGAGFFAGAVIGTATVTQGSRVLATVPVVTADAVAAPGLWERTGIFFARAWRAMFGPRLTRAAHVVATD